MAGQHGSCLFCKTLHLAQWDWLQLLVRDSVWNIFTELLPHVFQYLELFLEIKPLVSDFTILLIFAKVNFLHYSSASNHPEAFTTQTL